MCDIFPEVENCCFLLTLRVAMLFISVLSITTGCATLSCVEKVTDMNEKNTEMAANLIMSSQDYQQVTMSVLSNLSVHILNAIFVMAVLFMISGVILLIADLIDEEGLIQVFVWLEFLNVVIGFILMIAVSYECMTKDKCLLDMDWLSAAFFMTGWFFFLIAWIYFISVANSYVLNGE